MNRALVGKTYPPQTVLVTAPAIAQYARACNEDNPRFLDERNPRGIIAPPLFGAVVGWPSVVSVLADPELGIDLFRLLHREQDMFFYTPVRPGDQITSRGKILAIGEEAAGETLVVEILCSNQNGQKVQRMLFTAFVRGRRNKHWRRERSEEKTPEGEPLLRVHQVIDPDQTYRYAQASGDHNPIHTDEDVARRVGLPGIIVHGLCTLAFASKVFMDHFCREEPERLKRLRAHFSRPIFPGQTISTHVWKGELKGQLQAYAYETYGPTGFTVIRGGRAEVVP